MLFDANENLERKKHMCFGLSQFKIHLLNIVGVGESRIISMGQNFLSPLFEKIVLSAICSSKDEQV